MPTAVRETKSNGPRRALCLVHLVRAANGTGPLGRFLASYRSHPAGTEHDLVLLLKGFSAPEQAEPHLALARDLDAEHLFVADDTLDLGAYLVAARRLRRERYCFLNSFSVVLADDWLGMLDHALTGRDVGMVGATGSWASPRSQALRQSPWAPSSAYDDVFPDRRWMVQHFEALRAEQAGDVDVRFAELRLRINRWRSLLQVLRGFGPFPSPHLRTNAFAIGAQTLARLALRSSRRKVQTYRLESGRRGITRQVSELGLHTRVVDRSGAAFEPDDWYLSRTFWQGDQEQLLVADNQTRSYTNGDLERRTLLAGLAWGRLAEVTAPSAQDGDPAPA